MRACGCFTRNCKLTAGVIRPDDPKVAVRYNIVVNESVREKRGEKTEMNPISKPRLSRRMQIIPDYSRYLVFLREASRENRWSYFYASSPSPDSAVPLNQIPKWFSSAAFQNETTKKAKICDSRREPSSTPFFLALSLFLSFSLSSFAAKKKKKSICPVCSQENGLTRICSCFVLFSLSEKAKMQTTHIQKTRNV